MSTGICSYCKKVRVIRHKKRGLCAKCNNLANAGLIIPKMSNEGIIWIENSKKESVEEEGVEEESIEEEIKVKNDEEEEVCIECGHTLVKITQDLKEKYPNGRYLCPNCLSIWG